MNDEKDLKEGLQRLVGGQQADEILKHLREDRALTPIEKQAVSSQAQSKPLTVAQAQAILAHLGIVVPKKED